MFSLLFLVICYITSQSAPFEFIIEITIHNVVGSGLEYIRINEPYSGTLAALV